MACRAVNTFGKCRRIGPELCRQTPGLNKKILDIAARFLLQVLLGASKTQDIRLGRAQQG